MTRPTLDDIFAIDDPFGLLDVTAKPRASLGASDATLTGLREVTAFYQQAGRLPDADSFDHDEMRLGTIWQKISAATTQDMLAEDPCGLLQGNKEQKAPAPLRSWRDDPLPGAVPASLDDIFADVDLDVDAGLAVLKNVTPAAERQLPDHRADFVPCQDFAQFQTLFDDMQNALEDGSRSARAIERNAVIEPKEGDFFIRNGLLAYIAEKSEMTARGGQRDHRLRVIFSNGTESDPLMSSFRKSLSDDKTARLIQRTGFGPLDSEWDADRLSLSGTVYVARTQSQDPVLSAERMILHKIGVTSQNVRRRVADARNDPTFLLAPVEIIATYELHNLPRAKVENLLHRFFAAARPAELFIIDRFGKKVRPKEWFYVLPEHVSQAVGLLKTGQLHLFRYDPKQQKIVGC